MDDVVGEIVFVVCDENFLVEDVVCVIRVVFGVGFYVVEIGIMVWFGEVYGFYLFI